MRVLMRRQWLHVWNVQDYIKQSQANLTRQDNNKFIAMNNIFQKLYLKHLRQQQYAQHQQQRLQSLLQTATSPARAIADYFHAKSKSYSQSFLRVTLQTIGQACQVSKQDNNGTLDNLGYKLFLSSEFNNLSEELKYALRNDKISFNNLVPILQALLNMQYVDYEIINLLLLWMKRELRQEDSSQLLDQWPGDRQYQIEKQGYYDPSEWDTRQSIRNSPELSNALSFVRHIYGQWNKQQVNSSQLRTQNIEGMTNLINQLSNTSRNFRQIVESILSIRMQYLKMVRFSSKQSVLRNPNLNLNLLQLEEKLLGLRLLDLEDIKQPENIASAAKQVKRVQRILLLVLDINKLDPVFSYVDKQQVQVPEDNHYTNPNSPKALVVLNFLSKLAELDRHVYHTPDGRSCVSLKWEKTLIQQQTGMNLSQAPINQALGVSRVFRRVFADVVQFVKENQDRLLRLYDRASLKDKFHFLQASCRLGLQQTAIQKLLSLQQSEMGFQLTGLGIKDFEALVGVMNDIGVFSINHKLKDNIFNEIKSYWLKEKFNQVVMPLEYTVNALNYLVQNHRNSPQYSEVYQGLLQILELKAASPVAQIEDNPQQLISAFRILALEFPYRYALHPIYINYLDRLNNGTYKKNPFADIVRESCLKWINKDRANPELTYLLMGFNRKVSHGLVVSPCDQTSLSGHFRSGHLNSQFIRLQLSQNVKMNELSVSSLMQIDYSKTNPLKLDSVDSFRQKIQEIMGNQLQKPFQKDYEKVMAKVTEVLEEYKQCLITDRIRFKLIVIDKMLGFDSSLETLEQEIASKSRMLLEVLQLNKLLHLLNRDMLLVEVPAKEDPNPILNEPLSRKQTKTASQRADSKVKPQVSKVQLQNARRMVDNLVQSISKFIAEESAKNESQILTNQNDQGLLLNGQRQSVQTLQPQQPSQTIDLTADLLNSQYFQDRGYCQYSDWQQIIGEKYYYQEVDYASTKNITKILINRYISNRPNKVVLMPMNSHQQRVKRLNLSFNVFSDTQPPAPAPQIAPALNIKRQITINYLVTLQNFKRELKTTFSQKQLVDYITGFKFSYYLEGNEPPKDQEAQLLPRDPESYFNYWQSLQESNYMSSPYTRFILSKLQRTDKVRLLLDQRKDKRIELRMRYQKGLIDGQVYFSEMEKVDSQIISALQELKGKLVDNTDDKILESQLKMLEIRQEQLQAFGQMLRNHFGYSRHFDQDYIAANADGNKALTLKRGRAQVNYVRFCLLKKLSQGQQLSGQEKKWLRSWHQDIIKGVSRVVTYSGHTWVSLFDMPWEDLQRMQLKGTALNANRNMLLIDFIMQINHFLDPSLLLAYQREVKADYLNKKYNIPHNLFGRSHNPAFSQLALQAQRSILDRHSQLSSQELDKIETMFQIHKTQGFKERNRYEDLCGQFRTNLELMNTHSVRNELVEEYVATLQEEFMKEYNPNLVTALKKRQTSKLWWEIFNEAQANCSRELLRIITQKLLVRLELMKGKAPPFFGNLLHTLLQHPQLDFASKQSLIAAIEINNVSLDLDSKDIVDLSQQPEGHNPRPIDQVLSDLKGVCNCKTGAWLRDAGLKQI